MKEKALKISEWVFTYSGVFFIIAGACTFLEVIPASIEMDLALSLPLMLCVVGSLCYLVIGWKAKSRGDSSVEIKRLFAWAGFVLPVSWFTCMLALALLLAMSSTDF